MPNSSHLLWTSNMLPTAELESNSVTPATIFALLDKSDARRFSHPITKKELSTQLFRLQADGGENHSVTNNRDMRYVSWDIEPYLIDGIGGGITYSATGIFHLICDNGSALPVTMLFSAAATDTIISPTYIVFSKQNKYDSW